jgi:hypothetical protein
MCDGDKYSRYCEVRIKNKGLVAVPTLFSDVRNTPHPHNTGTKSQGSLK